MTAIDRHALSPYRYSNTNITMKVEVLVLLLVLRYGSPFILQPSTAPNRRRIVSLQQLSSTWQSHVSTYPDARSALNKVLDDLDRSKSADLAFLFVAQFHAAQFEALVQQASARLPDACRLVSVVGGGVIGDNIELDEPSKPGLSLLVGSIPNGLDDVEIFYFNELAQPPPPPESDYWSSLCSRDESIPSSFLIFADPWSPVEHLVEALGSSSIIAGGMSVSTGTGPTLAIDSDAKKQGSVVGVCFKRSLKVQVVVAQGCRPIGPTYTITSTEGNFILELDSRPAIRVLEEYLSSIESKAEQNAVSSGLVCGIQAKNTDEDYLIRQMLGFLPAKGGIAVGGIIQAGEKLRFHVRDKAAANEDLNLMVQRAKTERMFSDCKGTPVAALQISCIARGREFFGVPNADLSRIKGLLEGGPVAGFFANGEIGPVGIAGITSTPDSGTYLHGFTTVVALLCDMGPSSREDDGSSTSIGEQADVWG